MADYVLHELAASDWSDYRAIRLRSLQDSPDSFASLYEREVQFQMWVDPDHRGEGVGRALVQHIIQWAVNRHVGSLQLSVTQTNLQAIALYQSLGFAPEGALEPLRTGSFLQCQLMTLRL